VHGSGFDPDVQQAAELDTRAGCVGLTTNEEVNLLFARRSRKDHRVPRAWVAVDRGHLGIEAESVEAAGARVLFGGAQHLDLWLGRLATGEARLGWWRAPRGGAAPDGGEALPIARRRGREVLPFDEKRGQPAAGDGLYAAVTDETAAALREAGWTAETEPAPLLADNS
jgi:hypothetical protein